MSAQQQSLGEWVERVNHDIFYQQNEEVFNKAVNEDIDSGLVVRYSTKGRPILCQSLTLARD